VNKIVNNQTEGIYLLIDEMKGIFDEENGMFYSKVFQNNQIVKTLYLALKFNKIEKKFYPQINGISMMMPSAPVLFDWDSISQVNIYSLYFTFIAKYLLINWIKNSICNEFNQNLICPNQAQVCSCVHTLEFNLGDVVEFVIVDEGVSIPNLFETSHPMHLHGTSFAVMSSKKLNSSITLEKIKEMDKNGQLERNYNRPPIKDTLAIPNGGNN
jgi:FtsP/CotA-like multicopper oxidase with cupredoxin domain